MSEINEILKKIPLFVNFENAKFINKGFSPDEKWIITLQNSNEYFIKVCALETRDHKKRELEYMKRFRVLGVPIPEPIDFIELEQLNKCIQIFEYVDGFDGGDALPKMTELNQYKVGIEAGKALRLIHTLEKENPQETWETYRMNKYIRYQRAIKEMNYDKLPINDVNRFVEENVYLLKDRPVVFMHDDYHPSNLMFTNDKLSAVIDFDRYEWGDPYHDFHKMALFSRNVSVPFSIGQVHGYFDGDAPLEFWQYYSLYAAMIFTADIVWSHRMNNVEQMKERLSQILKDHDLFTRSKPLWYDTRSEYFLLQDRNEDL